MEVKPRNLDLAGTKREINKLMAKGIDRGDVACLVLSWGTLIGKDLEEAIWYLHDWKPQVKGKVNPKKYEGLKVERA